MKSRILFIYPNSSGIRRVPLGISILSACLKKAGHSVELFDTTFFLGDDTDNLRREEIGIVKKVDMSSVYSGQYKGSMFDVLLHKVKCFKPNIIAISILQDNYYLSNELLNSINYEGDYFTVAGGIMPTLTPELILDNLKVDAVIIGEGENAMVELADNIAKRVSPYNTSNLAYKISGELKFNSLSPLKPLAELPDNDYSIFDKQHLWRPFIGKVWKTAYLELTRGCPYKCTFCANSTLNALYRNRRMRSRDLKQLICEVNKLIKFYSIELVSFCDENFLSYKYLEEFAEEWRKISIPFLIQTRVETISSKKVKLLKEAGCVTISIGIESGDEFFRKKYLKRNYSNIEVVEAFKICKKYDIRTTANNIIGFPFETETNIISTINLNKRSKPDSISVATFAPYIGCELYDTCRKEGLIGEKIPHLNAMMYNSALDFSLEHKKMLKYYFENFQKLVFN